MNNGNLLFLRSALLILSLVIATPTQAVDFEKEIAPLLRRECIDCHNSKLQMGGLRFDLKEEAMQVIEPNNSEDSLLMQRLLDDELGVLMPPKFGDGSSLPKKSITLLRTWIDEGAPWPDGVTLGSKSKLSEKHARIEPLRLLIREGKRRQALKLIKETPELLKYRNLSGSTLLHSAALYGDAELLSSFIAQGAEVNAKDEDGLTPLMLAVNDSAKVKILLNAGADPNAKTISNKRTPLEIASTFSGNLEVVKLLLNRQSDSKTKELVLNKSLSNAVLIHDLEMTRTLIEAGAVVSRRPFEIAAGQGNLPLLKLLLSAQIIEKKTALNVGLAMAAVEGSTENVRFLLENGATPTLALPYAAYSEFENPEIVKILLDAGADPSESGRYMLRNVLPIDFAKRHGRTKVVELLEDADSK